MPRGKSYAPTTKHRGDSSSATFDAPKRITPPAGGTHSTPARSKGEGSYPAAKPELSTSEKSRKA